MDGGGERRSTGVDLEGLLTVLGAHLYSTPVVAVRELVQNAHDSIVRRQLEDPTFVPATARIEIDADPGLGVLRIHDNGSGLTAEEVHAFLATIGAGYTRTLRARAGEDDEARLIGQFGLGFLSAFVVADEVTVDTCSFVDPGRSWRYRASDGQTYALDPGPPGQPVGSVVHLRLKDRFRSLAEPATLRQVLGRYGALLAVPLWFAGDTAPVNAEAPPWRVDDGVGDGDRGAPARTDERRRRDLAFAARFEPTFEPLCTFPVAPHPLAGLDPEVADVRGLLWVQDGGTYGSTDNRHLTVFVRGMLLDDDARDLLPPWAGFVGGVVESERLTPTASREDLQRDGVYAATREALTEAIVSGLAGVAREEPAVWRRILARHAEVLRGTALCDPRLFDLLADVVPLPTSQGDLTVGALRAGAGGVIHVALGAGGGFEEMLFRSLKVPVARGERYAVVSFLRRYAEERGVPLVEVGTEAGDRTLFHPATLDPDVERWLADRLAAPGELLVPATFAPPELPLVLVPDREAELKARLDADDADRRMAGAALALARTFTDAVDGSVRARLYLNLDCPAVAALAAAVAAGLGTDRADDPDDPDGPAVRAARLLRSVKTLLVTGGRDAPAGGDGTAGGDDLAAALADVAATVDVLLRGGGTTPPGGD